MLLETQPESRRKEIFLALVEAQDGGASVVESRKRIEERFGVSEQEVRHIEREGLDHDWPPL
jgi:hypothetical protein